MEVGGCEGKQGPWEQGQTIKPQKEGLEINVAIQNAWNGIFVSWLLIYQLFAIISAQKFDD